jgi:hypothetical protein
MNRIERKSEIIFDRVSSGIVKKKTISKPAIARRTFLTSRAAVGASVLLERMASEVSLASVDGPALKESDITTNGITLHVTEQGDGPTVLFCHGFRTPPIPGASK